MHQAQSDLDDQINGLHDTVRVLVDRLQPVLGSQKPASVDGKGEAPMAAPTVANRIYGSSSGVRLARQALQEIIERLEV